MRFWWLGLVLLACERPVDRAALVRSVVSEVSVEPAFVREGVEVAIHYRARGLPPTSIRYEIGETPYDCTPEALGDGRFRCVHPGLSRDAATEGTTLVVVRAQSEGESSFSAAQITVDFTCPRFLSLSLEGGVSGLQAVAAPGDTVVLSIESSEPLGGAPKIFRGGREWGVPTGEGTRWTLVRPITDADPALAGPIIVSLTDRAGNRTDDCEGNGQIDFVVDHQAPEVQADKVLLERGEAGLASRFSAEPGAMTDDVAVLSVVIHDGAGLMIAQVPVEADGSVAPIAVPQTGRVLVEAVDGFGRTSPAVTVPERWLLSVGSGASPGSRVQTAVRFNPAPPASLAMYDRTVALAPDIQANDARTAVIRAAVGFEKVGDLPSRYEGANLMFSGYEPVSRRIVVVGGYRGDSYQFYSEYMNDFLTLNWDTREGRYVLESGPPLSYLNPAVPYPRYGVNIAFDGQGCGLLVGGDAREAEADARVQADAWQLCWDGAGWVWTRITMPASIEGQSMRKFAPILWDPQNRRYVIVGGSASQGSDTRVVFAYPDPDPTRWRWVNLQPLPTTFGTRSQNFLYWDPRANGFAAGLGYADNFGNGENRLVWTYRGGQWVSAQTPFSLAFRAAFGWAYDEARRNLVIWGGSTNPNQIAEREVRYLTASSTAGPDFWRTAALDAPVSRDFPELVYDADREVVVVFGGIRPQDDRPVPTEIHQIISQPSYPQLQAVLDLVTPRPRGIAQLRLQVRAAGVGDADGLGANNQIGHGYQVLLWDHAQRHWEKVAENTQGGLAPVEIVLSQDAERYLSPEGTLPVTVLPLLPTTEAVGGRLEVDLVRGVLELRPGVTL